ncbi:helicase protein [Necator americanus]|uniref:Helicase protein n=1 Tax=Necator americanus TaxID=51031 RepID=W2TAM1_NECAM|nr:helicase protein [Necator americanus]ETN78639.1 helicase protein [Necator americanus]
MDDLLSVALSEAGLEEFLTPAPPSSNSVTPSETDNGISPSPSVSSPLTNMETQPQSVSPRDQAEEAPQLEAFSKSTSNSADDHVTMSSPSTSKVQHVVRTPGVNVVRKLSAPCNLVYRQTSGSVKPGTSVGAAKQVRISFPADSGTPQLFKQTVYTPDGPKTQVLRPFINEHGKTVYRAVRTIPASVRGLGFRNRTFVRNISDSTGLDSSTHQQVSSSESPKEPQRVIVFRQNTPAGTVLIRKPIPPGVSLSRTFNISNNRGAVRRFVARYSAIPVRSTVNYSSSSPNLTSYSSYSQLSTDGLIADSGLEPISIPSYHAAELQLEREVRRIGEDDLCRTEIPTSYCAICASNNEMPDVIFEDHDKSARNVTNYASEINHTHRRPFSKPNERGRHSHPAIVGSASATLLHHRAMGHAARRLPTAGAEVAASVGAFEHLDVKRILSGNSSTASATNVSIPTPTAPPKSYTKSQKAKDEMRLALQTATEKRSEIDEDEENLGYAETYADYVPAKLRSGVAHPDYVVETASLSSVAPPDVKYQISIPEYLIDNGSISALQLEAVIYACQMHQQRLPSGERIGYLIGDGAGVGKGRTVAAIIFENYLLGRKRSIWLSVSSDLKFDAERDLRDIGAGNIMVYALNKLKYAKISGKENGNIKKGVIFATYSSLIGECRGARAKYRSRLKQLIQWFGVDYDGVIILDECHRAKNLVPTTGAKPTKTGRMVLELQKALPNARVVYASATGATEPRNMAYMTRLGLWGQGQAFPEFINFINAVERRGVGAMEIVAMDMKGVLDTVFFPSRTIQQRGLYLARQLSFRGVSFTVQEVPLSDDFVRIYDDSVKLWLECRRQFQNVLSAMTGEERSSCKQLWGQFWACHQRFFKYLCIAAKVDACVQMARDAIKANKCVVIGLQSTGEARTLETLEEMGGELTEFVSTAKAVLQGLIERHFPTDAKRPRPDEDQNSTTSSSGDEDYGDLDQDSGLEEDADGSEGESNLEEGDDWLKALLAEAASSSESDEDDPSAEVQLDTAITLLRTMEVIRKEALVKKNSIRLTAISQTMSSEELEELRQRRRARRKRRKKRLRRIAREAEMKKRRDFESDAMKRNWKFQAELLSAVERLGPSLPPNTLDHLIDQLGGPEYVAEMTGRKGRIVTRDDGEVEYELRHAGADVPLELMNMDEKDKFMKGEKKIAIISEAASSGISLQSDRRAQNTRRRVHITLELPWSADKAIQQFGRTHRSNQVSAPEYVFLISELAGEKRFASIVAKRLESLGALTHGDRRATETRDLSQFNLDNRYGRDALEVLLKSVTGTLNPPLIPPLENYKPGDFFQDMRLYMEGVGLLSKQMNTNSYTIEREAATIPKFLNRILGIPVHAQNALFHYFTEIVAELIAQAKLDGTYDMGIMDLGTGGDQVRKLETRVFVGRAEKGGFRVEMQKIGVERGVCWDEAFALFKEHNSDEDGFYVSNTSSSGRQVAVLVYGIGKRRFDNGARLYAVTRPSIGRSPKLITMAEITKRFVKVLPDDAKKLWEDQYAGAIDNCHHTYLHGKCKSEAMGVYCEVGRRTRTYFVLSGSVLSVWPVVEEVLSERDRRASRMQVIRVRTDQDQKIVGLLVLPHFVRTLVARLEEHCSRCFVEAKKDENSQKSK